MFDPVHLGLDEYGEHVHVNLAERNMLLGGEPGGGKSSGLNLITAHGALSYDCKLILVDGKQVQLGPWRHCADMFIGPSINDAIEAFRHFQDIMNDRYDDLLATGRRKITRDSRRARLPGRHRRIRLLLRHHRQQARTGGVRRAGPRPGRPRPRGRGHPHPGHPAALPPGHRPVHAGPVRLPVGVPLHHRLQLRRRARRRAGPVEGYTAADIDPLARGVGWLLSETGVPRRIKAAYLTDDDIKYLAAYAARLRGKDAAA